MDRIAKKESRKRGSGRRKVNVDALSITEPSKKSDRMTMTRHKLNLESALIKEESIRSLPRFRNSDSFRTDDIEEANQDVRTPEGITANNEGKNSGSIGVEGFKIEGIKNEGFLSDANNSEDDNFLRNAKRIPLSKVKHNVKIKKDRKPDPRRTVIKPRTAIIKEKNISHASISLSKTKLNEKQKPLYINTTRIQVDNKMHKRLKITTLDVLKHLVQNFKPILKGSGSDEQIHEDFKQYLLFHLDHLIDMHSVLNNLSKQINYVQRRKNELRSWIFELKNKHALIGKEISHIREQYQRDKEKSKKVSDICKKFELALRSLDQDVFSQDISMSISAQIDRLAQYLSRDFGTLVKLEQVNNMLESKRAQDP